MNIFVAFVSDTYPSLSSIMASSAFALFPSIFASMLLSRLLWWIFESKLFGELRRVVAVTRTIPFVLSYTGGFHSASTIKVHPYRLNAGLIPDVTFFPRVRLRRICELSNIPFRMRVVKMASFTSSRVGTLLKAKAFAESNNLSKCSSSLNIFPL
uniref:Uncharacterized protein n=1 Tax=Opuntia streptacantha TaxID=393608 RepID=A0A7C8Z0F3_OPUST